MGFTKSCEVNGDKASSEFLSAELVKALPSDVKNLNLNEDDKIFVITTDQDAESVKTFIGEEIDMERKQWIRMESQFINRRILITKPELNGKKLGQLKLRKLYGINITRINRAGVDLVATPGLTLQVGDRVNVVGTETAVSNVEKVLGNSMKLSLIHI